MPTPHEKLRDAHRENRSVTVTLQDGTACEDVVYEDVVVWDFTRVQTDYFEIWRFVLRRPGVEKTLFGPDLKTVEDPD